MLSLFKAQLSRQIALSDAELEIITKDLKVKRFERNEMILREGEVAPYSFFINKGLLRIYSLDEKGKEHIIQFAPENWWLSERNSQMFNLPSDFYIDAIEATEAILIPKDFIEQAAKTNACILGLNNSLLNNSIRFMQKRINMLLSATAEARYLDFIKLYPNLSLRVPQWMIASYLGITPESLSRVRKDLTYKSFKTKQA